MFEVKNKDINALNPVLIVANNIGLVSSMLTLNTLRTTVGSVNRFLMLHLVSVGFQLSSGGISG